MRFNILISLHSVLNILRIELVVSYFNLNALLRYQVRLCCIDHCYHDWEISSLERKVFVKSILDQRRGEGCALVVKKNDSLLYQKNGSQEQGNKTDARPGCRPVHLVVFLVVEKHWRAESVPFEEEVGLETTFLLFLWLCTYATSYLIFS